jgi:poly-gamma-glutamate synthesis protein (capsule biosynthesis protein)
MNCDRRAYLATGGCASDASDSARSGGTSATDTRETRDTSSPSSTHTTSADADTTDRRETRETTLEFAGDTMLGRDLNQIYGRDDVDPAAVWGDFQSRLESVDGVFCNLECSLSTRGDRFPNRAYCLRGNPAWAVPALDAGNVTFVSLANNHAMDFGPVALTDTIGALDEAGIENAGTGETPAAAWTPATVSVGGLDVAVVSFADEYEAYAATDDRPGIAWAETDPENPRTQRAVGNAIERARATDPDLLVASVHWGKTGSEAPATASSRSATGS